MIVIEQLDASGKAYRTFRQYPRNASDADRRLNNITRAYNLDRTRVTYNGRRIH